MGTESRAAVSQRFKRQRVEELQGKGLTRAQIAERLGLTKGQVDGVLYKAELTKLAEGGADLKLVAPRNGSRNRPSAPVPMNEILPVEVNFDPPEGKVSVYNARNSQCRWVNDDGYFCGETTMSPSKSYCNHHHALCWVKTRRQVADAA